MKRDIILPATEFNTPSFLSCEKDIERILMKLFVQSKPYSDYLKKLLIINTADCLDNNSIEYKKIIDEYSLSDLHEKGYIKFVPKLSMGEHEDMKAYIIIAMDNFFQSSNNEYRECTISFDILCHTDCWDLGNFRLRPLKIAGYIDGILNKCKLTGIGKLEFISCKELLLDESIAGYTLLYRAYHGTDDSIPDDEE